MIIITGGAGFIGSVTAAMLNHAGHSDILLVDNLNTSEKWQNMPGLKFSDYFHKNLFINMLIEGEFDDDGIEAIIHMGACSSTTETDGDYLMENNYRYSRALAEWCLEHNVRFIYASSAATYGAGESGFSDDDKISSVLRPINRYGYSKQIFDQWVISNQLQSQFAGLKFFNVYGPNEYHKGEMASVIYKAYHQILKTGKLKLFKSYNADYPDGGQKRDFVYVKDCAKVILWLLENKNVNGIFNLGTGIARTWNDLAASVFTAMQIQSKIDYIEMPENLNGSYQYFTCADMKKITTSGYVSKFHSLEDGISDYIQNYLQKTGSSMQFLTGSN